jgi:Sigma-70, region 4
VEAPASSGTGLTADARRILAAIDGLPADEPEAFSLVRIEALTLGQAAELLGVSTKTVQRRLNHALLTQTERRDNHRPTAGPRGEIEAAAIKSCQRVVPRQTDHPISLEQLPPAERQECRALWGEIDVLIRRAQTINAQDGFRGDGSS